MDAYFNVHFFKERTREIDHQHLLSYFESLEGTTTSISDAEVIIRYEMPRLGYEARFLITKKSKVPNISRLSPKFLDLNFHLEIPLLTPNYCAIKYFEIVKLIANEFDLHIYSEMFEDVLPFRMDLLNKAFSLAKEAFINKNPSLMRSYNLIDTNVLSSTLRYYDEILSLQMYYQEDEIYVPKYLVLKNKDSEVSFAFEWKEGTKTVFPPNIKYIFYRTNEIKIVKYEEALIVLDKLLKDVPGFIKNTKVTGPKIKKIHKIMRKTKFNKVSGDFDQVTVGTLIDI